MEETIIIVLIITLFILYTCYQGYKNNSNEKYCNQSESNTCALLAPNIPDDPRHVFKIGGKYCKPIKEQSIASDVGRYKFVKQELMYDGIWKSDREIDDNKETQQWTTEYRQRRLTHWTCQWNHLVQRKSTTKMKRWLSLVRGYFFLSVACQT